MKKISFISYEKFLKTTYKPAGHDEIIFYSRLYGNRDWGFVITGLYNIDLEKNKKPDNYMQVQFLTHNVHINKTTGEMIADPKDKVITLKGITEDNYNTACKWIEEHRNRLGSCVIELKGAYNPLMDLLLDVKVEEQTVIND